MGIVRDRFIARSGGTPTATTSGTTDPTAPVPAPAPAPTDTSPFNTYTPPTISAGDPPPVMAAPPPVNTPVPSTPLVAPTAAAAQTPSIAPTLQTLQQNAASTLKQLTPIVAGQSTAAAGTVDQPTETVQGQLRTLLQSNNPLLRMAYQQALEGAANRGLLNSSLAGGAGQLAMYQEALPIAQSDAEAYRQQALTNEANRQQSSIANAQFKTQANLESGQERAAMLKQSLADLGTASLMGYQASAQASEQFRSAYYAADATQRQALLTDWAHQQDFTRAWSQNERSAFLQETSNINDLRWRGEQAAADRSANDRIAAQNRNLELTQSLIQNISQIGQNTNLSPAQQAAAMQQLFPAYNALFKFYDGTYSNADIESILDQLAGFTPPPAPAAGG